MSRKKRPSKALLKDLKEVFEKHGWPGTVIGTPSLASATDGDDCPPGTTPHDITVLQDGRWVTKTICT